MEEKKEEEKGEENKEENKEEKNEEKDEEFRNYEQSKRAVLVKKHYTLMRTNQTMEYVLRMEKEWSKLDKADLNLREIFEALKDYVDSSDPDFGLPNILHAFQTAEAIRKDGKPEWFQLTGLLHDVGKIQFVWGSSEDGQSSNDQQFALGGDTWVVGARIPDTVVLPELNKLCPDMQNPLYNTELGIYSPGIGLSNVHWCWGHDEYMYRVLKDQSTLPKEALAMIRFHSAYPWHSEGAYKIFESDHDKTLIPFIKEFNKYDLYTKHQELPDIEKLFPYYENLFEKFIPRKKLKF